MVQVDFPCNVNANLGNKRAYVNGVVYWMISAPNAPLRIAIVGFDFTEENFREIQLPKTIQKPNRYTFVANLGVLNQDLYVSVEIYPLCFELWVMSNNGEGQTWNKIYVIPNYENDVPFRGLLPVCILRGQVLLQADNRYLFLFDPVNVKFQQMKFRLPPGPCCKFRGRVYEKEEPCCAFQAVVYEKSIVSPYGYFWLDESRVDRLRR